METRLNKKLYVNNCVHDERNDSNSNYFAYCQN